MYDIRKYTSAMSSDDGSTWFENQLKKFSGPIAIPRLRRSRPLSLARLIRSMPCFHWISVLVDLGSPPRWNSFTNIVLSKNGLASKNSLILWINYTDNYLGGIWKRYYTVCIRHFLPISAFDVILKLLNLHFTEEMKAIFFIFVDNPSQVWVMGHLQKKVFLY